MVTWGLELHSSISKNMKTALLGISKIYSSQYAFAAIMNDGIVVSWFSSDEVDSDPLTVEKSSLGADEISLTRYAYSAVLKDGDC